jgi:hypothetical protein
MTKTNLIQNLETFLSEIQSQTEMVQSITEDKGTIIIRLNVECFADFEKASPFLLFVASLKKMLHLDNYIKMPETNELFQGKRTVFYRIDLVAFHADRLETFFHKDITQQDVATSIEFLIDQGWTEKCFKEIGVSHATFHRYHVRQKDAEATKDKSQTYSLTINTNIRPVNNENV